MNTRFDGQGKVALVTGGSRGIGLGIARALLDAGAAVVISGREQSHLDSARHTLSGGSPDRIRTVRADVRSPEQAATAVMEAVNGFGGLDILINNAGIGLFANVTDMSIEQWQQVIDTNLSGVFYCCRAAIPQLRKRGGGWIINISSLAGKNAFVGASAYCASKAGLNAFSEALMQEIRYENIRVSYIMPGSVATSFGERGTEKEGWALTAEDVAEVVVDLLSHPARSLPSRVELRPSRPKK